MGVSVSAGLAVCAKSAKRTLSIEPAQSETWVLLIRARASVREDRMGIAYHPDARLLNPCYCIATDCCCFCCSVYLVTMLRGSAL